MELEGSEGSSATGMHDSFRDPFVVEAHDLHWVSRYSSRGRTML